MAYVDRCETADEVREAARDVYRKREAFEAEMRRRHQERQNQPLKLVIVPDPPPKPNPLNPIIRLRGQTLVDLVAAKEDEIRSILEFMSANRQQQAMPTTSEIQRAVCRFYKIERNDLIGKTRTQVCVRPRMISYALCRRLTLRSLPQIGMMHGDRDHTTILNGIRKMQPFIDIVAQTLTETSPVSAWVAEISLLLDKAAKK